MKIYKFPFMVAYSDTDAEGVVYHGRYIEIAERARMSMLRGITFPDNDLGFVVRELNIKYMRPLKLADEFVVASQITEMGVASLVIEQKFVKDDEIYAIMKIKIAYIGENMRPVRIPDVVREMFAE